jgi:hypothetical protein
MNIFQKNVYYSSEKLVLFVDARRPYPYTKADNQQAVDSLIENHFFASALP